MTSAPKKPDTPSLTHPHLRALAMDISHPRETANGQEVRHRHPFIIDIFMQKILTSNML